MNSSGINLKTIVSRLNRYNLWANEKMVLWLKALQYDLLCKEVPSSFGSIEDTLQHMVQAQNFWIGIITETDYTMLDKRLPSNGVYNTFDDLLLGSQKMVEKFELYREDELLKPLPSKDMIQSRYEYIYHLINHSSYHRGQIVTISRFLGVKNNIPALDYEVFLWSVYPGQRLNQ